MGMATSAHEERRRQAGGKSSPVSWPHFGGMLALIAGTVGFWALVLKHLKGENRKGPR
jgi:hypothetical protein